MEIKKDFYKNLENYAISNRDYYDENGGKKAINAAFKDFTSRTLRKIDPDVNVSVDEESRKEALKHLSAKFEEYFKAPEKIKRTLTLGMSNVAKNFRPSTTSYWKGSITKSSMGKRRRLLI